ncbi:MAG: M20/M25/M40 family metallo-hydrolase [Clostridia bacterium]|nr:M20/M25/M40 family metallo-hydrolase [Clostridia bacterium]
MELKRLITSLCSLMSVSGHEQYSYEAVSSLVGKYFDEIKSDGVGNILLVRRCGKENAAKIMIDTHFDEIGMLVTKIHEGGFLSVTSVGGLDLSILQATDVVIYGRETITGVIASTPPHLKKDKSAKKLTELSELLIDTGYEKEELEKIVSVGTPVGFSPVYTELLGDRMCGKSFDNKACAAAAIYALSKIDRANLAADVYLLLSCHEETLPTGGVAAGAFAVEPDYAMVIDVNLARVPDTPRHETVDFDAGVSISISAVTDKRLTRAVEQLCREKKIKYTRVAAPSSTGTNTPALNLTGRGVPTVDIGLPLKSMHTYNEVLCIGDVLELSALVREFVCSEKIREGFAI